MEGGRWNSLTRRAGRKINQNMVLVVFTWFASLVCRLKNIANQCNLRWKISREQRLFFFLLEYLSSLWFRVTKTNQGGTRRRHRHRQRQHDIETWLITRQTFWRHKQAETVKKCSVNKRTVD